MIHCLFKKNFVACFFCSSSKQCHQCNVHKFPSVVVCGAIAESHDGAGDGSQRTIHHVAGTGQKGFTGNGGDAKTATLSGPKGISLGPDGNVYLADTESHSIRMIEVRSGVLKLIAGTGERGDGPEGNPLQCKMARPHGVFVDRDGAIYIGDSETHRVRVVRRR